MGRINKYRSVLRGRGSHSVVPDHITVISYKSSSDGKKVRTDDNQPVQQSIHQTQRSHVLGFRVAL